MPPIMRSPILRRPASQPVGRQLPIHQRLIADPIVGAGDRGGYPIHPPGGFGYPIGPIHGGGLQPIGAPIGPIGGGRDPYGPLSLGREGGRPTPIQPIGPVRRGRGTLLNYLLGGIHEQPIHPVDLMLADQGLAPHQLALLRDLYDAQAGGGFDMGPM